MPRALAVVRARRRGPGSTAAVIGPGERFSMADSEMTRPV
jgi:hypothetical protein